MNAALLEHIAYYAVLPLCLAGLLLYLWSEYRR